MRYLSHVIRRPFAKAILWVLKPVLGPMLSELEMLVRMNIQRSVHFSDVIEKKDGNIKFSPGNPMRTKFIVKEEE